MSSNNSNSSGGVGFFGLLTIVFIVLKLTDYIDWSWWLVLMPTIAPLILILFIFLTALIVTFFENKKGS